MHHTALRAVAARARPFDPDYFDRRGRTTFGTEITASDTIFTSFHALDETMAIYYSDRGWVRTTADVGDIADGDAATVERAEIDTLGIIEPTLGTEPTANFSFDLWIPTYHYNPGGGCQIVLAQIIVTTYGPPIQILWHPAGNIRCRSLVSGSFQHAVLLNASEIKGRWSRWNINSKITKNSTGFVTITVDGVVEMSSTGIPTVGATGQDASKVYAKCGVYRTATDTDANRGLASLWFKGLSISIA